MKPTQTIAVTPAIPTSDPFNIAPCLAHPCDASGKNPCKITCAFARTNLAGNMSAEYLETIITAKTYGCSMGGAVKKTVDGKLVMQVGSKIFPSQDPLFHPEVAAAQGRLDTYTIFMCGKWGTKKYNKIIKNLKYYILMEHSHNHTFSRKHLREHPICLATLFYGALIIIVELTILSFVTDMHLHDFLSYEGVVQLIHLIGIIILAIVNYRWIHRVSGQHDTPTQATTKFFGVSVIILIAHIVLLHVLPRWIGFELHHHDESEHSHGILSAEMIEYLTLGAIIVFVTLAFRFQDTILQKLHLKNKYTFMLGSGIKKNTHHHHHHGHHHH